MNKCSECVLVVCTVLDVGEAAMWSETVDSAWIRSAESCCFSVGFIEPVWLCRCVTSLHDYWGLPNVCVYPGLSRQLFSALQSSPLHLSEPIQRSAMQRGRKVCMCVQHSCPFVLLKVTAALKVKNEGNMFHLKPYFLHPHRVWKHWHVWIQFSLIFCVWVCRVDIENGPRRKERGAGRGDKLCVWSWSTLLLVHSYAHSSLQTSITLRAGCAVLHLLIEPQTFIVLTLYEELPLTWSVSSPRALLGLSCEQSLCPCNWVTRVQFTKSI